MRRARSVGRNLRTAAHASAPAANCVTIRGSQAPWRIELAAGQQQHHGRQRRREGQPHQAPRPGGVLHPEDDQNEQTEQQVGQPFRTDRPGRSIPTGSIEIRLKPQLHQQDLAHIADRGQLACLRRRHVTDVQRKDDPHGGQVQGDQVHRPHPGQPQPQEVQVGTDRPRPAHAVEVVPGQHEPTEDEEEVYTLRAAVEHRREGVAEAR